MKTKSIKAIRRLAGAHLARWLGFSALLGLLAVGASLRAETVIWQENFDDGNGNSRWSADHGVWQIGAPTLNTGPGLVGGCRSHSCPDCATTGLTANYPGGADSRLIRIQPFTVPPANLFPRLRFWHWYNFSGIYIDYYRWIPDYGVVEIKAGNGSWQAVSPQYTGFSGDWTYASVDLRAYAGQTVQLAFHLVPAGGSAPGWYVDDIALEAGTPMLDNPESWEHGIGDWHAETGTWQVGVPTSGPGGGHGGATYAATILSGNYPGWADSRLISPPFQLPPASASPSLRFWHWYNFSGNPDYGVVEIKVGANAWKAVSPSYTGTSGAWAEPFVDLTPYGGQTVQLAFHLVPAGGSAPGWSGWYVDDIEVSPYVVPVGPILSGISDTNILAEVLWQYAPTVLGGTYTFAVTNAPPGMSVDATGGTISWTPLQTQAGPTFSNVTYLVSQGGVVIASTSFNISVIPQPPHAATATPVLANGFLTGINIINQGAGYTNTPGVRVIGGGGTGAQATAVVSDGVVVEVDVSNPGRGYTNAPVIVIAPPFIPQPTTGISALSLLSFAGLQVGANYQFQAVVDGLQTSVGDPFAATNASWTRLIPGTVGATSYNLTPIPSPQQATATGQVVGGFLVGVNLTSGGSGYTTNPAVTVYDNGAGGSGAMVSAFVDPTAGVVTNLVVESPGIGYTNGVVIAIAPPPAAVIWPSSVTQVMQMDFGSLSPYDTYQILFAPALGRPWTNAGAPFTPTATSSTQYVNVSGGAGFLKLEYLGH